MIKAEKFVITYILLLITWLMLTQSFNPQELIVGAIVSAGVALFSCKILFTEQDKKFNFQRLLSAISYVPFYFICELRSHFQVIRLILHPQMPVKPGIVRIETDLRSDFGITALANSITMTPGTLTVETDEKESALYVHWIEVDTTDPQAVREDISDGFERYLRRIFE